MYVLKSSHVFSFADKGQKKLLSDVNQMLSNMLLKNIYVHSLHLFYSCV